MSKQTRIQVAAEGANINALSTIVSAKNPDGSDWALAVFAQRGQKNQITPLTQPGTTPQLILATNPGRIQAVIVNAGTQTVYLGRDNTVTATSFMLALSAGATYNDEWSSDAWWGITSSGTGNIQGYQVA